MLKTIFILYLGLFSLPFVSSQITLRGAMSFVYENTVCHLKECCIDSEIPGNFDKLQMLLDKNVFGQHIAVDIVVNALRAHWDEQYKAKKALILSFHGWPGSGKTYVAKFIVEGLFRNGINSNYVHYFSGRKEFGLRAHVAQYQDDFYNWVKGNVTRCPKQLFIIDEVDKMPPEVIFIFLSNAGENNIINDITNDLWIQGVQRKDIKLEHFENIFAKGAFNEDGGLHQSDAMKNSLIDFYVPFLPLEAIHVEGCILRELTERKYLNPTKEDINYFLNSIEWSPNRVFAKTGCKRISQKVGAYVKSNKRMK